MAKSLMSAVVAIKPDLAGFKAETVAGVRRVGDQMEDRLGEAGRRAGDKAGEGIKDGVSDGAKQGARVAERELGAASKRIGESFGKMQAAGAKLSIGVTAPLVLLGKGAFDAAANIADLEGAVGVTFGEQSQQEISKWADTLAASSGISKQAALDAALTFGTFGKAAGLQGAELQTYSQNLTQLAGDMASFRGTSTEEAITAIGAALRGETEPIRKYGVMLDDMTMRQKAVEMQLISSTKQALDPQTKALVANALIFQQTTDAQGDFLRTADSAANSVKAQQAEFQNLQGELGKELIPVMKDLIGITRDLVKWFSGLDEGQKKLLVVGAAAAAIAGPLLTIVGTVGRLGVALVGLAARWGGVTAAARTAAAAQAGATAAGGLGGGALGLLGKAGGTAALMYGATIAGGNIGQYGYENSPLFRGYIDSLANTGFGQTAVAGLGGLMSALPGMAAGGTVTQSGASWVGENGPELLTLPRGAQVTPLDKAGITITGPVTVVANDPREFARQLDKLSRRAAGTTGTRRLP